ncbi:MAG: hypothetical protein IT289_07595 [Oligoflexia bacterium]|nr:hypothetical protein [Oligoflexia bacterium]
MSLLKYAILPLFILCVLATVPSGANEIPADQVPPLFQIKIYQSELAPDHYIVLGKDGIYADAGNWYVLNIQNGKVTSPKLRQESYMYFGGGFDFRFESGEWLYIPGGNSSVTAPGATLEVIPPGLIDPNRGRTPLKEVKVTESLLTEIGVDKFVSPDFVKKLAQLESQPPYRFPKAPPENIHLLVVKLDPKSDEYGKVSASLKAYLKTQNAYAIQTDDLYFTESSYLYIWTFAGLTPTIQAWLKTNYNIEPVLYRRAPDVASLPSKAPVDIKTIWEQEPFERLKLIISAYEQIEATLMIKSNDELKEDAMKVGGLLAALEQTLQMTTRTQSTVRHWEQSEQARFELSKLFIDPIRSLLRRGYEILNRMQIPMARQIFLFAGKESAPRIQLLTQPSGNGSEDYFETWLSMLKGRISWIKQATKKDLLETRQKLHTGALLSEFSNISVQYGDYLGNQNDASMFEEERSEFPLLLFGIKDSPQHRAALVRFVIEMDKLAQLQKDKYPTEGSNPKIFGSLTLHRVITGLVSAAEYEYLTADINGFSRALFFRQAMMIVTELLNTSRITIVNSGTYLSILNTAISLQKTVTRDFGVVPNAQVKSEELNRLTEQLLLLHQAVQVRMVRGIFENPEVAALNCAGALRAL